MCIHFDSSAISSYCPMNLAIITPSSTVLGLKCVTQIRLRARFSQSRARNFGARSIVCCNLDKCFLPGIFEWMLAQHPLRYFILYSKDVSRWVNCANTLFSNRNRNDLLQCLPFRHPQPYLNRFPRTVNIRSLLSLKCCARKLFLTKVQ